MTPTREILFNVAPLSALALYALTTLPIALLVHGLAWRVRRWRMGRRRRALSA